MPARSLARPARAAENARVVEAQRTAAGLRPSGVARRGSAHWVLLGIAAGGWAALALGRFHLVPDPSGVGTHEQLGLPPCLPMRLFGIPCPGCGLTTSVTWLARGAPLESLAAQPLGFAIGLAALGGLPWALWRHVRGRDQGQDWNRLARRRAFWLALGGLVAGAWLYKWIRLARG
jgi:hypothetical protein